MLDMLSLAFLNTLRNFRRTVITLFSIVVGYVALAGFGGFIEFTFMGLRETTIRTGLGHVQVYAEGYNEHHTTDPEKYLLSDPASVEEVLEDVDGIETVTWRLSFSGLASAGSGTVNVQVVGVAPEREEGLNDFEVVLEGRQIRRGETDKGVIGAELSKGLGAKPGDWVTLVNSTVDGVINSVDFEVVGIVSTGSREFDSVFVKLPISLAQRAWETEGVQRALILLEDTETLDQTMPRIKESLQRLDQPVEYRLWYELAGFYRGVVRLYNGIFSVFLVIVGMVVMFSIANTMTMAVFERIPEIGALRAFGVRRPRVLYMFVLEGVVLGTMGAVLGVFASLLVAWIVDLLGGIAIPAPPGMSRGYQAFLLIHTDLLIKVSAVMLLATVLSSIYPAWTASRVKIVEALHKA